MSKKILVLGAGLSASGLIQYLLDCSQQFNWLIIVADRYIDQAKLKLNEHPNGIAKLFDIDNIDSLTTLVNDSDAVISLLPAKYHPIVAKECLKQSKHMFTTSYVSAEMKLMHEEAINKDLLFLNECGLDPGIDHMSAMKIIDEIKEKGGKMISFESNTGGLIAPAYDNNPWNYKFTWNPRNVILAGQAGAKFLQNKKFKYIPYTQLFNRTERISVLNYGEFDVYANRDSISYRTIYQLHDIDTLFRGTLRRPGYCQAWHIFVQLGMTDDTYTIEHSDKMTYRDFLESYLPHYEGLSLEETFCKYFNIDSNSDIFKKFQWVGMFDNTSITLSNATAGQILQSIIEPKWKLEKHDLDMIVMQHKFIYELDNKKYERKSSLVVIGKDQIHTAMSITVGIPLAIAVKLFLTGAIQAKGVVIPVEKHIYTPLLDELERYEVSFIEEEKEI